MTDPYSDVFGELTRTRSKEIIARHSQPRSALLHLVQSVEAHVSRADIAFCAEEFELTTAEVAAPATGYTMYKRTPCGRRLVSVCTTRYARHRAATRSASGVRPHPPRGAPLMDFRTVELELAGVFPDLAVSVEGLSEAPETLLGVTVAADRGWAAPAMPDRPPAFPAMPEKR
jgi:hypothetical protein